jgi:indolepyruvate ferredoxin oxidoreductase beta subunit
MKRSVCILIGAMGGEGGGVLADWLITAATEMDFPVQSTSVPGVAQRTGATTYYVEIFPVSRKELAGKEPLLSLTPTPGQLDLVAASELVEAGRAIQNGYVDPKRTVLVTSTHREFAVSEKSAMADGRYDSTQLFEAAKQRSRKSVLLDMRTLAQQNGTVINTVLFGVMASTGVLPFTREVCENAIRESGKSVDSSLRGFAAGYEIASPSSEQEKILNSAFKSEVVKAWPKSLKEVTALGASQAVDYQDEAYSKLYLERVAQVVDAEKQYGISVGNVSYEFSRCLAVRMTFEDVIRVADLKTRSDRLDQVRREAGAKKGEPVQLTEFLKPGFDEICSMLPIKLADLVRSKFENAGKKWQRGLKVRTDTVSGFFILVLLRSLRPLRRRMSRFQKEQEQILHWQHAVVSAISISEELAIELVKCGSLVKGYGETSERGHANLNSILQDVEYRIGSQRAVDELVARIRQAREAALSDPSGKQLGKVLGIAMPYIKPQPIHFFRKRPVG